MVVIHKIDEEVMDKINDDLGESHYGWFLDSNGSSKYFLSVFNRRNYSEELIFEIDFNDKELIIDGLRFPGNDEEVKQVKKSTVYYKQAKVVAKYIINNYSKDLSLS